MNPLEFLLQQSGQTTAHFAPNSRYHGIETASVEDTHGQQHVYVRRRFIAPPEDYELLQEHRVSEGERPDHLAYKYLGDAEQFWRICDANVAMNPLELTEAIGKTIRITLPVGIPK